MATTMNQHRNGITSHRLDVQRSKTPTQKICIGMGILFIVIGLAGIMMPGFMQLHLSLAHNLIHLVSGALALWAGYGEDSKRAYYFALTFGVVYGLLGLMGFILGQPGYPGVGHMEADQNLLRVIPNVLEFGSPDHSLHVLLAAVFLFTAFAWKKRHQSNERRLVDVQRGAIRESTVNTNHREELIDDELGKGDISRPIDIERRNDFERRL